MKRFYLVLIFITGLINLLTLFFVLYYVDPYQYGNAAYISLMITFNISFACAVCFVLYFIKKIYYRGKIDYTNVLSSIRQGGFLSLFITGIVIFSIVKAPIILSFFLLLCIFIFLELIAQSR